MISKKDHIAIIGAGFSGMACAYYLSRAGFRVTLYDDSPIGENASGISAGLLHCYTGARAKPPPESKEKMEAALELLQISGNVLRIAVYRQSGVFRPAMNQEQEADYRQRAEQADDLSWRTTDEIRESCSDLLPLPGIWIKNGYTVDTKRYLEGLWLACSRLGAHWEKRHVDSVSEMEEETVILATGASTRLLDSRQPIHPVKGQLLEIEWDVQLPYPISANIYLIPGQTPSRCYVGGTFEHHFEHSKPDIETAKELLLTKMDKLFPNRAPCKIISCHAALRGSTPDRRPICGKIDNKIWILAGMGSKGLLNHAYYAKKLAAILK